MKTGLGMIKTCLNLHDDVDGIYEEHHEYDSEEDISESYGVEAGGG